MKSVRLDCPIGLLCRAFGMSRSGFYAWLNRAPSPRVQEDERLKVAIKEYIEIFYNRRRRHSRLGYVSPAQSAEKISKTTLAA